MSEQTTGTAVAARSAEPGASSLIVDPAVAADSPGTAGPGHARVAAISPDRPRPTGSAVAADHDGRTLPVTVGVPATSAGPADAAEQDTAGAALATGTAERDAIPLHFSAPTRPAGAACAAQQDVAAGTAGAARGVPTDVRGRTTADATATGRAQGGLSAASALATGGRTVAACHAQVIGPAVATPVAPITGVAPQPAPTAPCATDTAGGPAGGTVAMGGTAAIACTPAGAGQSRRPAAAPGSAVGLAVDGCRVATIATAATVTPDQPAPATTAAHAAGGVDCHRRIAASEVMTAGAARAADAEQARVSATATSAGRGDRIRAVHRLHPGATIACVATE